MSARITRKPRRRTSTIFVRVTCVAVARSSSDGVAIRYVLPVLQMTSCFHTTGSTGRRTGTTLRCQCGHNGFRFFVLAMGPGRCLLPMIAWFSLLWAYSVRHCLILDCPVRLRPVLQFQRSRRHAQFTVQAEGMGWRCRPQFMTCCVVFETGVVDVRQPLGLYRPGVQFLAFFPVCTAALWLKIRWFRSLYNKPR